MDVVIVPMRKTCPFGKPADARFTSPDGPLAGLKLARSPYWENQWPGKGRHQWLHVTVPARDSRRARRRAPPLDLVRPIDGDPAALEPLREAILEAYTADAATVAAPPVAGAEAMARRRGGGAGRHRALGAVAPGRRRLPAAQGGSRRARLRRSVSRSTTTCV